MQVKGLIWLGLRTTQFEEMVKFFRDVMGMQPIRDEPEIARFQLTDGTQVELYRPDEEFHAFFTTGPVVAFRVDDVDAGGSCLFGSNHFKVSCSHVIGIKKVISP
jgi:catechol 2,3-dioxygenase-like lactoylglutathione lyase family enzyme